MKRRLSLAIIAVATACGSSPPPAAQPVAELARAEPARAEPARAEPAPTSDRGDQVVGVYGPAELAEPRPQPAAPPPPPAKPARPPVHERLLDAAGPIAGLPGWSRRHTADVTRCGGVRVAVLASRRRPAPDDAPLASVLQLAFPTGLSFEGPQREGSMKKFQSWLQGMQKTSTQATSYYQDQAASAAPKTKVVLAARIAQISSHMASILARAEIPLDVRTGDYADEKVAAFCDALEGYAEPLLARAEEAAALCREHLAAAGDGWWTAVCAPAPK